MIEAIEIGVDHRRVERVVALDDGEGRRRHLAAMPQRSEHGTRQRGLARTQIARQRHDIACAQLDGDALAKAFHRREIGKIDHHGSVIVALVPTPLRV